MCLNSYSITKIDNYVLCEKNSLIDTVTQRLRSEIILPLEVHQLTT